MDTSTTDFQKSPQGGALADGMTLVRFILAPIVAAAIVWGWPQVAWACLASFLFAMGALTDLLDDMLGGGQKAPGRIFGWFDDVADAVLIGAALLALIYVLRRGGGVSWLFLAPALIYMGRDVLIGIIKGFEFSKMPPPRSRLGDYKNAAAMAGISLMIASPWLQMFIDRIRATPENAIEVYGTPSTLVWNIGLVILWAAAALALYTAYGHLTRKPAANEA